MRLYYFTSSRFGLEAIRDKRLKIARINELNDPFEFLGVYVPRQERRALKRWKNKLHARYGLLCMSRNWRHPLLWSHYADKYRGLALGFDVPTDDTFTKIEYIEKRPKLAELGYSRLDEIDETAMHSRFLYSKFLGWSYEAEYRAFLRLEESDSVSDLYFAPFSDRMKLAEVIVGERSSVTRERLNRVLAASASDVSAFKSRAGFHDFEVVENQLKTAWR